MSLQYSETLKAKYAGHPQVRRIARHRQVPKYIYNAQAEIRQSREKATRKYFILFLHFFYILIREDIRFVQNVTPSVFVKCPRFETL